MSGKQADRADKAVRPAEENRQVSKNGKLTGRQVSTQANMEGRTAGRQDPKSMQAGSKGRANI
jgi:hypothetical protein